MLIVWISGFAVENVFFQETQSKIPNKQQTEKQKITQKTKNNISKHKNKQNRFNILRGALFLWFLVSVFEWLHRHDRRAQARSASHPAKANPPFSSRELPNPPQATPHSRAETGGLLWRTFQTEAVSDTKMQPGTKTTKNKAPRRMLDPGWNSLAFLVFGFCVFLFFWFVGSLYSCFLVLWFFGLNQRTKKT